MADIANNARTGAGLLTTNKEKQDGVPEQSRASPIPIVGKLEIHIAGVVVGAVEVPADVEPKALPQALKFDFKLPDD